MDNQCVGRCSLQAELNGESRKVSRANTRQVIQGKEKPGPFMEPGFVMPSLVIIG